MLGMLEKSKAVSKQNKYAIL
jgi:hypothetical protein